MSEPIYADPDTRDARESKVPLGRLGTATDVAEVVLFLASERGRLRPRAEHPGRRRRHRVGDRPPATTALGRLGRASAVSTVVVLAGGLPARPRLRRDRPARSPTCSTPEHEVRTVAHPEQLADGARRRRRARRRRALVADAGRRATSGGAPSGRTRSRPRHRATVERSWHDGGGLLAVHTALDLLRRLARVGPDRRRHLGWGSSHPPCGSVSPRVVADHPVVAGVADVPSTPGPLDEVYGDLPGSAGIDVLAVAKRQPDDDDQPVVWTHRYGAGRVVFGRVFGHDAESLATSAQRRVVDARGWPGYSGGRVMRPIEGMSVLVTGGGSGIGRRHRPPLRRARRARHDLGTTGGQGERGRRGDR